MADVEVTPVSGQAARFLAARRDDLNRRFERARRRWPRLDGPAVLGLVAQVVAPLAGPEPAADDLCTSVYDLVLLHAGRETIAAPGLTHLLHTTLPAVRPLLLTRPGALPGALSNAVENMGARGADLSALIAAIGPRVVSAEQLGDLAALGAWRLGEARLREAALRVAAGLPATVALAALGLEEWPEHAWCAVAAALEADAWTHPRDVFSRRALDALRSADDGVALARAVTARPAASPSRLALVAWAGDFAGFGGTFARPPVVLDGGDRHTLFARVEKEAACDWRLDVDLFGAAVTRVEPTGLSPRKLNSKTRKQLGHVASFPMLDGATSFAILGDAIVTTQATSHRIRIHVPRRDPL